jgi:hypothetical protein
MSEPIALAGGRLLSVSEVLKLDGRTGWFAADAGGFAPMNSYLFLEPDGAVLVDTGVAAHADSVLAQLASLIDGGGPLSVAHTRVGEFNSTGNTSAVLERFDVDAVYGAFVPRLCLDYRVGLPTPPPEGGLWHGKQIEPLVMDRESEIPVGAGGRTLSAFLTPLRLLSTHWIYDEETRSLLTSDSFGHVYSDAPSGPWVVDETTDTTDEDRVMDHLMAKFEWLSRADVGPIQEDLASIFEELEIDRLCPGYGCIIEGRALVRRHYELMQGALTRCAREQGKSDRDGGQT